MRIRLLRTGGEQRGSGPCRQRTPARGETHFLALAGEAGERLLDLHLPPLGDVRDFGACLFQLGERLLDLPAVAGRCAGFRGVSFPVLGPLGRASARSSPTSFCPLCHRWILPLRG